MKQQKMFTEDVWDWKRYFPKQVLFYGEQDDKNGYVDDFQADPKRKWARCETIRGFHVEVYNAPTNMEELEKYPDWNLLRGGINNSRREDYFENYFLCDCSQGEKGMLCRHLASLMFHWEKVHGPFFMNNDPAARAEWQKKLAAQALNQAKKQLIVPACEYFEKQAEPLPSGTYFHLDKILKEEELQISQYDLEQGEKLIQAELAEKLKIQFGYLHAGGDQALEVTGRVGEGRVHAVLTQDQLLEFSCTCGSLTYNRDWTKPRICAHGMAFWTQLRYYVAEENPGDRTDGRAAALLAMLTGTVMEEQEAAEEDKPGKRQDVSLSPRVIQDKYDRSLKLSFDISQNGGRPFLLKNFENLVSAVEEDANLTLGKTCKIEFASEAFTEESLPWYQMIASRVQSIRSMNRSLNRSFRYYPELSAGFSLPMEGSVLDQLYDQTEGGRLTLQWRDRNDTYLLRVEETRPRAEVSLSPQTAGKKLTGIVVTGRIPHLLQGASHQYVLDDLVFGRASGEGLNYLKPFQRIAGDKNEFRCVIGEKKYPEFAFRVLPVLRQSEQIALDDQVSELLEKVLPPEPEFTFYIDLEENISCRVAVQYGTNDLNLGFAPVSATPWPRDLDQENRVLETVRRYFSILSPQHQRFEAPHEDDRLMTILTEGVAALSRFGTVKGSEAFSRIKLYPSPKAGLSIRLESDLLDLSIQTRDLTREELLDLLTSYRQKKRWHRLRSGSFVDLRNPESLREMEQTLQAINLSMEALLKGEVHLPKYRALYVDKLLETHEELAASRDRQFKSLVRSFQTIRDSDFEAPEKLNDQLRPYQLYGFRWLSTLSQFGFGGILADEMGLGKTLQMLSWMLAQKKAGEPRSFLVVCPASLVYNWGEECRKFTPELVSAPIDGPLARRKAIFREIAEGKADLYITSYDLLKRDIELYHDLHFSAVVLDEAQYIKNQKANVSKAVRVLKADHRFALTGTPIENRLAELWSIFDFLMPGFLYTSTEFASRFESPIMKQKNPEVTQQLSRMTEPFILRRRKADVLKDLPEKLEEIRTADMKEDQRKLYDAQVIHMREVLASSTDNNEDKMKILAEITRLRQICCDPSLVFEDYHGTSAKRSACLDLIQSAIDGGHRMLVFSQFTSMLDLLAADLKREGIPFYTIAGSTPKQERLRLVNYFNNGDTPVFLISLKAGGTGLNLTGADVVIHYDPWWNLAVQNQATDRAHRIGQTQQVTVMKLIAAESIEEKIVELQEAKRELADAIISGQSSSSLMSLSREELLALIG